MMTQVRFERYLVSAYEGEVGGHAYFNRLAACYADLDQSQKLVLGETGEKLRVPMKTDQRYVR